MAGAGHVRAEAACDERFKLIGWPGGAREAKELTLAHFEGGKVIATGADVVEARPSFDYNDNPAVMFRMSAAGARAFGEHTRAHIGEPIGIVFDGRLITAPRVMEPILGGNGMVTGQFTVAEATDMAAAIAGTACAGAPAAGS